MIRDRPAWLLSALLLAASGAQASPEDDPLLSLLRERGHVAAQSVSKAANRVGEAAGQLVLAAMNFIDTPYRRGGNAAETGFDCSGFTRHVFDLVLGLRLPRRADEQARAESLQAIERTALAPGDLVFFNTLRRAYSHVGIYIGEGRFIHAPRSGAQVRVEDMTTAYWARRFDGARRVADTDTAEAASPR